MTIRRAPAALLTFLLLGLSTALAEETAPPVPPTEKDPVSGVAVRGLMWRLAHTMAGRPVMAVGYGTFREDLPWLDEDFARAASDVEKLQIIAAKNSPEDDPLFPFQAGNALVIAPQTRSGVNPDLARLTPLDVTGRGLLMAETLARLNAGQVKALGSDGGLAVSSLPQDMRQAVARAFRPPMDIVTYKFEVSAGEDGLPRAGIRSEKKGALTEPLDLSAIRLRARLKLDGAMVRAEDGGFGFLPDVFGSSLTFEPHESSAASYGDRGVDLPIFPEVPNTFKPSDLEGRAFTQPIGISGVWTVKQVVERLATVTGLKLSAWEPYRDEPVFLGAKTLAAGDVLDGLRLALTAAWRKLGDAYYLAWDRVPLKAIDLTAREAASAAVAAVKKQRDEMDSSAGMWRLISTLPFDAEDPLALANDQREKLFGAGTSDSGSVRAETDIPGMRLLAFSDLTKEQQAFLRREADSTTLEHYSPEGQQPSSARTMTAEDLNHAAILPHGSIVVTALVPGKGWIQLGTDEAGLQFSDPRPPEIADADKEAMKQSALQQMPKELRDRMEHPQPIVPPSALRGLIVPALGPSRLTTLADEMKRHGLNILFYPALSGGYGTFPTQQFPLHPAMRGADGLAAALSVMPPKGIRVAAYLETLAWQDEGDTPHWLDRHPDWLDEDVLGRGRLAWFSTHGDAKGNAVFGAPRDAHNYVRAAEPRVEARLRALLRELAARKDVSAVAFAGWNPVTAKYYVDDNAQPPDLGYALPDRIAAFQKTGADPADAVEYPAYVPESLRRLGIGRGDDADTPPADPRAALVARLLAAAKAARKDWRTYVLYDTSTPEEAVPAAPATPKPDLVLTSLFADAPVTAGPGGWVLPVRYKTAAEMFRAQEDEMGQDPIGDAYGDLPLIPFLAMIVQDFSPAPRTFPMVLYDFRDAPDIITDALQWVKPSAAPGSK